MKRLFLVLQTSLFPFKSAPNLTSTQVEEPEPVFRSESSTIEMGYCFGTDYIVVYRSTPEGDQLIGNSSNKNMTNAPPADLRGRTDISDDPDLLGFQIHNLTHLDSGIYRRECWKNQMIISQKTQQLIVCKEEIKSELISVNKENGGTELLCRSSAIGSEETSLV
uniref:Immunoglobulin V-set domain-containing protein n=1 Tax=Amphilophus citrinellus TaxID=61819 RepID=A0A3Q0RFG8_AMPCI